jgi:alpha-L-rhamnosidase
MKIDGRASTRESCMAAKMSVVSDCPLSANSDRVRVKDLKVDYLDEPLGLENLRPHLSWRLESDERNVRQSAYRVLVASEDATLRAGRGDLWDSGKVHSRKSIGIEYSGRRLISRQRCWWCVQVWDENGSASAASESSCWEMGLLESNDWAAQWLAVEDPVSKSDREASSVWIWGPTAVDAGRPRRFRFTFQLLARSRAAELFAAVAYDGAWRVSGIWIDGAKVVPADSDNVSAQWLTVQSLEAGEHVVAVEVTPRWLPSFMAAMSRTDGLTVLARLPLESGETLRIQSGPSWRTSIAGDSGWNALCYDDKTWDLARQASVVGFVPWPARPAMYLRRLFSVDKPLSKARLYATALGAYEARLNGERVGDALLTPEPSQYDKRVLYRVYDITSMLRPGLNALGLIVGDGWYASGEGRFEWGGPPRRVLAQLELSFVDGSQEVIATGPGWRTAESPIRASEIRVGEVYDARLEQRGWDTSTFDDAQWQEAEAAPKPACLLRAQTSPPIRVMDRLTARAISQPNPVTYVFDFGQNLAGWCRLHVTGNRGTRVELRFAELLTASGEVEFCYNVDMGEPKRDVFILRGDASGETFEPRFTYRGFRYVQVAGLPEVPQLDSLEAVVIRSDLDITGRLRIGDPLIEALWDITLRTQCCNFAGIPTDCPSREQRGWMNDVGHFWDAASFNMDIGAFSSRQMENAVDGQLPDGAFPMFAPWPPKLASIISGPPGWGDGGIILPWVVWQRYGDTSIIERNWDAMNCYVRFILNNNPNYLWRNKRGGDFGDWLATDQVTFDPESARTTPKELIGTAYWARSADLLSQMALAIGRSDDSARLRTMFDRVCQAFVEAYVTPEGVVGDGSQTCYVLALQFGLLPASIRKAAAERLAADIRARGVALTTGFLGTPFILDVLANAGFTDLAYGLLLRTDYPSWGYMLRQGATTLWESWSGEIEWENKKCKISHNHFALGGICGFLFRRIAGIDAGAAGFETIIVRPVLDARVRRAGADYESIMGKISTDWIQGLDGGFELVVVVPANTSARIYLPAGPESRIEESRQEISRRTEITVVSRLDQEAVIEVGSGRYRFCVR